MGLPLLLYLFDGFLLFWFSTSLIGIEMKFQLDIELCDYMKVIVCVYRKL